MRPITLFSKTDVGKERATNEDSVASLALNSQSFRKELNYGILVVADGMGGHDLGEIASDIASKRFVENVTENIFQSTFKDESIKFNEILTEAISSANKEVWSISQKKSTPVGTTLVGAIITEKHFYVANVGDSRAYLIKPGKSILQITKDHSAVQEMVDAKIITKEQAKNHPRRNVLTRALGLQESVAPDIFEQDLSDGTLMLCSDGLYNMIDDKEIYKLMNGNIYKSADELISLANQHGGDDNISVAIARYSN